MRRGGGERRLFWEAFEKAYPVKATAVLLVLALVVVGCGKEGAISRALSRLNYDSLPAKAPRPTKPAEKLHFIVAELKGLLEKQGRHDLSGAQATRAQHARAGLATQLLALERQFASDRRKLSKLGGDAALARLDKIETKTSRLANAVHAALAHVPTDGSHAGTPVAETTKLLTALSPDAPQQPLSTGFGTRNAKGARASLSAGITPAYAAPTATEAPSDLPRTPEQADLDETPETRVTPAIDALATQLGGDPVKIYGYVRNNIRYAPYYGIRKGADQTLVEKSGSDADQAALLIALLRDSGIQARFVQGTAELPAGPAANWLGVDTQAGQRVDAVPDILASGGIPTTQVRANGELVKIRFEHVWAEAYVPNDAYRGAEEELGGRTWLPLDASVKQNDFQRPAFDFAGLLRPRVDAFVNTFADGIEKVGDDGFVAPPIAVIDANAATLVDQTKGILADHGISDNPTPDQIVGTTRIGIADTSYLPASTPFRARGVSSELRTLPASLNASVTVAVSGADPLAAPSSDSDEGNTDGFVFTAPTRELVNKRITLAYVPATDDDAAIIDAYHGLLNAPTYAAALIPVLRVDGRVVARGHRAVSTGYTQALEFTYRMPGFAADVVANPVYVGSLSALSLATGPIVTNQLRVRAKRLAVLGDTTGENFLTDARGGEFMSILGSFYFARNDRFDTVTARASGIDQQRLLSGGIVASDIGVSYIAGFPVFTRFHGLEMDVDEDVHAIVATKGDDATSATYLRMAGIHASSSESTVFSRALGGPAVSTAAVIGDAMARGIALMKIDASNVGRLDALVHASTGVKQEIAQAVNQDAATAYIPASQSTIDGWTGSGYVIDKGSSIAYRITGGFNGSAKRRKAEEAAGDANRMAASSNNGQGEDDSGQGAWLFAELMIGLQLLKLGVILAFVGAPAFITVTLLLVSIALVILFAYIDFREFENQPPTNEP